MVGCEAGGATFALARTQVADVAQAHARMAAWRAATRAQWDGASIDEQAASLPRALPQPAPVALRARGVATGQRGTAQGRMLWFAHASRQGASPSTRPPCWASRPRPRPAPPSSRGSTCREPARPAPRDRGLSGLRLRLLPLDAAARHHRHAVAHADRRIRPACARSRPAGRRLLPGLCADAAAHGQLARPPRPQARDRFASCRSL